MKRLLLTIILLFLSVWLTTPITVQAATINVPGGTSNENRLVLAIEQAAPGDILDLQGQTHYIEDTGSDASPWAINKEVTIQNGTISLDRGGIVLGANVTFENVQLSFGNPVRNVIAANGYTLTLNNVERAKTDVGTDAAQQIHLFCGTMLATGTQVGSTPIPTPGSHGTIIITGSTDLGNVYAGDLSTDGTSTSTNRPATITVNATNNVGMSYEGQAGFGLEQTSLVAGIYASGAIQTVAPDVNLDAGYIQCPPLSSLQSDSAPINNGTVTINLGDGSTNLGFDVAPYIIADSRSTGTCNVIFNGGEYLSSGRVFTGLSSLSIVQGKLEPGPETQLDNTDVTMTSGSQLYLKQMNDNVTAASLKGEGTLILKQQGSLTVTGDVGGPFKLAIEGLNYTGTSTSQPWSGHNYIVAENAGGDSFSLLTDDLSQQLVKNNDGSWSVPSGGSTTPQPLKATAFSFTNDKQQVTTGSYSISIPLSVTYEENSQVLFPSISSLEGSVPEIRINGKEISFDEGELEYKDVDLQLGIYFIGEEPDENLYIYVLNSSSVPDNTYVIEVTIPGASTVSGTPLTDTIILTVGDNPTPVIVVTSHPQNMEVTEGNINSSLSVTATISDSHPISYQWYSCSDANKSDATLLTGENSDVLTLPTDLNSGTYYYFCRISSNTAAAVDSHVAKVTVNPSTLPPVITIDTQPQSIAVTQGNINESLSITASSSNNGTIDYQWYSCPGPDKTQETLIQEATEASFSLPVDLSAGTYYYFCRLTAANTDGSDTADSDVVSVTVNPTPILNELLSITPPASVSGIINGTPIDAITLPTQIGINTTQGMLQADVVWNKAEAIYDASLETEQIFTVEGIVALPQGVTNPNSVSLTVTIDVTVLAKDVTPLPVTVTDVSILSLPSTTVYTEGDSLDLTGLEVRIMYSDTSLKDVTMSDFNTYQIVTSPVQGATLSQDITNILIQVENASTSFVITVNAAGGQGGTTPGGSTPGGSTPGGSTPGGSTPGGSTPGGSTPGGSTPGGSTPGGSTPGGSTPGGSTPGGSTPGGSSPGGSTPGGSTPGGFTPGGSSGGSGTVAGNDISSSTPTTGAGSSNNSSSVREQTPPAAPKPAATPQPVTYVVKKGDTLSGIARRYKCTVAQIVEANRNLIKNPNLIYTGWTLKIPQGSQNANTDTSAIDRMSLDYVVKKGDTLNGIARRYGCTVSEIMALNRDRISNPNRIYIGWVLKMPQMRVRP